MNFISYDCEGYADIEEALTKIEAGDLPLALELRQVYNADQPAQFGAPEGPTRLITLETFSKLIVEAGGYQQHKHISERGSSRELYLIRLKQNKKARYSC